MFHMIVWKIKSQMLSDNNESKYVCQVKLKTMLSMNEKALLAILLSVYIYIYILFV